MEKRNPNNNPNRLKHDEIDEAIFGGNSLMQTPDYQKKLDEFEKEIKDLVSDIDAKDATEDEIKDAVDYLMQEFENNGISENDKLQIINTAISEALNPPQQQQVEEMERLLMKEKIEKLKEQVNIFGNEVKTDKERHNNPKTINRKISDFFSTNYIISNMMSFLSKISKLQLLIELRKFKTKITLILLCGLILFHIKFSSSKTHIAQCCDGFYISTTSEFQYVNYLNSIESFEDKNEFIAKTKIVYFFNLTENTLYYIYFSYFILISILILSTKFSFSISNNEN